MRSVGTTCGLVCRHLASSLRSKLTHTGEGKEGERAVPSVAGHALLESSHVAHSFRVTLDSIQFRRRVIRPSQVDYRHSVMWSGGGGVAIKQKQCGGEQPPQQSEDMGFLHQTVCQKHGPYQIHQCSECCAALSHHDKATLATDRPVAGACAWGGSTEQGSDRDNYWTYLHQASQTRVKHRLIIRHAHTHTHKQTAALQSSPHHARPSVRKVVLQGSDSSSNNLHPALGTLAHSSSWERAGGNGEIWRSVGTTCGLVCRHLVSSLRSGLHAKRNFHWCFPSLSISQQDDAQRKQISLPFNHH